jgi:aerobic-type carbon monoxide dehydrogenase small subunit (CoxS/CutS family)
VLVDGEAVCSCLVPFAQVRGCRVTTIEGVHHPLQEAMVREGGAQCGICTPGIVTAAVTLKKRRRSAQEVREALAGNLCRCTGYAGIVRALAGTRTAPHPRVISLAGRARRKASGRK